MEYNHPVHSNHEIIEASGSDDSLVTSLLSTANEELEHTTTSFHLKPICPHSKHTENCTATDEQKPPRRRISFCGKPPKIFESHCKKTYNRSSPMRKIDFHEYETIKEEMLHYKMYEMKVHSKSHSNTSLHDKILKSYT